MFRLHTCVRLTVMPLGAMGSQEGLFLDEEFLGGAASVRGL